MSADSRAELAELRPRRVQTFRRGGGARSDVLLLGLSPGNAVLKDHNACDPWFARLLGPLLAWREARALRRLEGLEGVPRLLERPDRRALLLEHIDAQPILDCRRDVDWAVFFARLEKLLRKLHRRGVAHCDLRSPNNTLIDEAERPVVVDFVASIHRGRRWNLPWNWVFERFCLADLDAIPKLKRHVAPELLTAGEAIRLDQRNALERGARRVGVKLRIWARRWFTSGPG